MKVLKKMIEVLPNIYYNFEDSFFYNKDSEKLSIHLTNREVKIINYLFRQYDNKAEKYVSNRQIFKFLNGAEYDQYNPDHDIRTVTRAMSNLRGKQIYNNYYVSNFILSNNNGAFAIQLEESPFESNATPFNPVAEYIDNYHLPRFNISTLRYDAENTSFCGRSKEMKMLTNFVVDRRPLLWWAITGKGGSGKSRLAYEFMKSLNSRKAKDESNWKAVMIEWNNFYSFIKKCLPEISEWRSQKNYLIIIDYVQSFEKEIADLIQMFTHLVWKESKLRILLLERAPKLQDKYNMNYEPLWFRTFKSGWRNIEWLYGTCYDNNFIHLSGVDNNSACSIIRSYANSFNKAISDIDCKSIIDYVGRISTHGIMPLLLLCVIDTWLDSPELYNLPERISSSTIWSQIIVKEKIEIVRNYSEIISNALMELHTIACIIHRFELTPEHIEELFLLKRFYRYKHYKDQIISSLYESKYLLKIDYSDYLIAIEPDIIGEYFVYTVLQDYTKEEYTELFMYLSNNYPSETNRFIWRYLSDFASIASQHPGHKCLYNIIYDTIKNGLNELYASGKTIEEKKTFIGPNSDGVDTEYEVLLTFDSEETGKSYILYSDNIMDSDGNSKVYANAYENLNDSLSLESIKFLAIETEAEWTMIEAILAGLQEMDDDN